MTLTQREFEVLRLLKEGKTQADIAETLSISQPAVSSFKRNGERKIREADDLVKRAKDLGLLMLALAFFFGSAALAAASVPNPGHPASGVGPGTNGTFSQGNYTFQNNLNISGISYTPQLCLNGDCRTAWPASSSVWSNTSGNATFTSGNVGIGTTAPSETLSINGSLQQRFGSARVLTSIGGLNGIARSVIVGNTLYAVSMIDATMAIFDISDPSRPNLLRSYSTGNTIVFDIKTDGTYLYTVSQGSDEFRIYDITNRSTPLVIGSVTGASNGLVNPSGIALHKGYAFVSSPQGDNLTVFDIRRPSNPVRVTNIQVGSASDSYGGVMETVGDILFWAGFATDRLYIVNISNPEAPQLLGNISVVNPWDFEVDDTYAYVISETGPAQLSIINVTNLRSPTLRTTLSLGDIPQDIAIRGRYAYIANFVNRSVQVVDIANKSAPIIVGRVVDATALNGAIGITINGRYAYVGTYDGDTITTVDLGGADVSTLSAGDVSTDYLRVRRDLSIGGSIFVGGTIYAEDVRTTGSISSSDDVFVGRNLNVTQNLTVASNLCLNGDCRTAWPTGNVTGTISAGYVPYATNGTNLGNSNVYFDGSNIGVGDASPSELFVVGNGDLFRVTSAGIARGPNGATSGPTFSFTGDTDTGMYLGGVNDLRFATGNAARLTIDSNGNVGINTTTPTQLLDVRGNANISSIVYTPQLCLNNDCRTAWPPGDSIWTNSSGDARFATSQAYVDIGPRSEWFAYFDTNASTAFRFNRAVYLDTGFANLEMKSQSPFFFLFDTNASAGFRFNKPISIDSEFANFEMISESPFFLQFRTNASTGFYFEKEIRVNGTMGSYSGPLQLTTEDTVRMIINDTTGNVGIGVTNPAGRLTVGGSADWNEGTPGTAVGPIHLDPENSTDNFGGAITFGASDSSSGETAQAGIYVRTDGSYGSQMYFATTNNYTVGSTTRMMIDENGNVGIGILNSAHRLSVNGSLLVLNNESRSLLFVNETQNTVRIGWYDNTANLFVNGTINATGAITGNSGFDLAEMFSADEQMGPGDLVIAVDENTVRKATRADADLVIGAVSTQPGFILANPTLQNPVLIGLAGRIPVKVTGTVQRGDFITISNTPGIGEAAREPGFVIGRAIGDVRADGTVMIIIQPAYFSPQIDENNRLVGTMKDRVFEVGLQLPINRENRAVPSAPAQERGQDRVVALGTQQDVVVTLG